MRFDELKNGMIVTVESATSDYGKTNDPNRWWGAFLSVFYKKINGGLSGNLSHMVLKKIVKEGCYKVIYGGFKNGECLSAVTVIQIVK